MSHMSVGDCTITLQEVSTLLDLPIDGKPVTSAGSDDWAQLCKDLLGVTPIGTNLRKGRVKLKGLKQHFNNINNHVHSQL